MNKELIEEYLSHRLNVEKKATTTVKTQKSFLNTFNLWLIL